MSDIVKEPLTKEQKTKRILLIVLSTIVALVILGGFIFGSPYSIKRNGYSSLEKMFKDNFDRPTVVYVTQTHCPNCDIVTPQISQIKDKFKNEVNFYCVNIDDRGEGEEFWRRYKPNGVDAGKNGVPGVVYFYARKSADDQLQRVGTPVIGYTKNNYDDMYKKVEKLVANPYGN